MFNVTYNDVITFYNNYKDNYTLTYEINIIFLYLIFIDFTLIRFFAILQDGFNFMQ